MNYSDIRFRKEQLRTEILRKEYEIREQGRSIRDGLTFNNIKNNVVAEVINNPDAILRTGMMAFSIVQKIRSGRNK